MSRIAVIQFQQIKLIPTMTPCAARAGKVLTQLDVLLLPLPECPHSLLEITLLLRRANEIPRLSLGTELLSPSPQSPGQSLTTLRPELGSTRTEFALLLISDIPVVLSSGLLSWVFVCH